MKEKFLAQQYDVLHIGKQQKYKKKKQFYKKALSLQLRNTSIY